jgi:hypothetical protein
MYAGNWNNKLFPSPVGMTAMILGAPSMIAWTASLCTPRNLAVPDLIICCKPAWMSAPRKCFHLAACFASITASYGISLVFLLPAICLPSLPSWSDAVSKPNHKCHMQLTVLNLARVLATVPSRSLINRAYIIPATLDVWLACLSMIACNRRPTPCSPSPSSNPPSSTPSKSFMNVSCSPMNLRLIAIAISRYDWIVNAWPKCSLLYLFIASRICALVVLRPS